MDEARAAVLACLAARFSFSDFPDFLVMVCRGDLSDIAGPLIMGAWLVPIPRPYPFLVWASGPQMVFSTRLSSLECRESSAYSNDAIDASSTSQR